MPTPTFTERRLSVLDDLYEAAQLENALTKMYLYAAFTLPAAGNGLAQDVLNRWRDNLMQIAREEMLHMARVFNIIHALGGEPRIQRLNFPFQLGYRPVNPTVPAASLAFNLAPMSKDQIAWFIVIEGGVVPPLSQNPLFQKSKIVYDKISALYLQIKTKLDADINGFKSYMANLSGVSSDRSSEWGHYFKLSYPSDVSQIVSLVNEIMIEGEGNAATSHRELLLKIYNEISGLGVPAASNIGSTFLTNPTHNTALNLNPLVSYVDNERCRQISEVFSLVHEALDQLIEAFFSWTSPTSDVQKRILSICLMVMKELVSPLATLIIVQPLPNGKFTGPTFEVFNSAPSSANVAIALPTIAQMLREAKEQFILIVNGFSMPQPPALAKINTDFDSIIVLVDDAIKLLAAPVPPKLPLPHSPTPDVEWKIHFSGFFQCRFAIQPDDTNSKRGDTGPTFAVDGEPDFDRVIRFQPDTTWTNSVRRPGPDIGVRVTKVEKIEAGGSPTTVTSTLDRVEILPLVLGGGNLGPYFENFGTLESAEPINPFVLEIASTQNKAHFIRGADIFLVSPSHADRNSKDEVKGTSEEDTFNKSYTAELDLQTKKSGHAVRLQFRKWELDLALKTNPNNSGLIARKKYLDQGDNLKNIKTISGLIRSYEFPLRGKVESNCPCIQLSAQTKWAWKVKLVMGGWDCDALAGYATGELSIISVA
jgi:Ferritin-like